MARKAIPKALQAAFGDRREFAQALPKDPALARAAHRDCMARWEAQLAAARDKAAARLRTLTEREGWEIAGAWYRDMLADHEDAPGPASVWEAALDALDDERQHDPYNRPDDGLDDPQDADDTPDRPTPSRLERAEHVLRTYGIAADAASIARFPVILRDTERRLSLTMLRRAQGDYGPDRQAEKFPPSAAVATSGSPPAEQAPALPFSELVDRWAAENKTGKKSVEKWRAAFAGFAAVVGHDDARRVTVADVRRWKEARQAAGKAAKTVADGVAVMRATWNWGARNGLLEGANPFANMAPKVSKGGPAAREGFTDTEARDILLAARRETGWRRWLPWLLAFTGCRLAELADMPRHRIRQESGVWIADVAPEHGRSIKTVQSQRMVPLHPALINEGFLDYVASVPAGGPLFSGINVGRYGSRASIATKAHARWVREAVGITRREVAPAHSWRHRMEDELRRARVPAEAVDALMGHDNPRNSGAGYGRGYRRMPDETAAELAKVPSPLMGQTHAESR